MAKKEKCISCKGELIEDDDGIHHKDAGCCISSLRQRIEKLEADFGDKKTYFKPARETPNLVKE